MDQVADDLAFFVPKGPFSFNLSPKINEKILSQESPSGPDLYDFYSSIYKDDESLKLCPSYIDLENDLIDLNSINIDQPPQYNFEQGENLPVFLFYSTKGSLIYKNFLLCKNIFYERDFMDLLSKFVKYSKNDPSMARSRSFGSQLIQYNMAHENFEGKAKNDDYIFTRYDPSEFGKFFFLAYHAFEDDSLASFISTFLSFYLSECVYHKVTEDETLIPYDSIADKSSIEEDIWLQLKKLYYKICKNNFSEKYISKKLFEKSPKKNLTTENALKYLKKINSGA